MATVFFGGVHVWVRTVFSLAIFGFFLFFLWGGAKGPFFPLFSADKISSDRRNGRETPAGAGNDPAEIVSATPENTGHTHAQTGRLILDPPSLVGIFFVVWGLLQMMPLPGGLVQVLSPEAEKIWSSLEAFGVYAQPRISLYPYMTGKTLLLTLAFLLFYWTALYGFNGKSQIRWAVWGILLLGVFESLYGLVQLAGEKNIILWWENPFSGDVLTGTFVNRNHLAGFLSMTVCVAVGYLWSLGREENRPPRHRRRRRFYEKLKQLFDVFGTRGILVTLAATVMMAALLGSASRGGFLSLVCGIVFMAGLILARYFKSRQGFVLMVLLSLVLTYVGYVAADRLAERFQTFFNMDDRLAMARDTLAMGQYFPLTGSGAGTFEFVYPRFQQIALDKIVDYAHNDWVQLAAEYGWVGFGIVLLALAVFFAMAVTRWRTRHDAFVVGIGLGGMGAVVAMTIHSLSDFNLHIPANFLLLSAMMAITWRVLYSSGEEGEGYEGPSWSFPPGWRPLRIGQVAVTVLLLGASFLLIQTWRADHLARTFRNSTIPFAEPTANELRRARHIAPGNAAYWLWSADRLRMKPNEKKDLLTPEEAALPEPGQFLLIEGLNRNPSSWQIWRALGWTFYLESSRAGKNREAYLRNASRCLDMAASLRPADARLQMDSGSVALYAWRRKVAGVAAVVWQDRFRRAVELEPALAGNIADMLVLHLGRSGAKYLQSLLPPESRSYLGAASFLLPRGYDEAGMDLVREGEKKREEEIARLWKQLTEENPWEEQGNKKVLDELAARDRNHPGVLLLRGNLLGALKQIERRGDAIGKWQDTRTVANMLKTELEENRGDPAVGSYYLGRLALEEGNVSEAAKWLRRSLGFNPQYFPAWVYLRDVMRGQVRSAGDQVALDALEGKIGLFAMEGIVFDAWKLTGGKDGLPSWKAPFRVADAVRQVTLRFSAKERASWALYLDGRFVAVWVGTAWDGSVRVVIPPGEHEFLLVSWSADMAGYGKTLPFRLEVAFDEGP
jgi:O-antigen ligase/tetratricopeptide (TPR) repeat protein